MGLGKRNFEMLERAGVIFHYETAATELIEDRTGRITGVRALMRHGKPRKVFSCADTDGRHTSSPSTAQPSLSQNWPSLKGQRASSRQRAVSG